MNVILRRQSFIVLSVAILCLATLAQGVPVTAQSQPTRLGDLRVDWFCLQRGYSAWLINNGADWACTSSNGAVVLVLKPADLNTTCQGFYRNQLAYASLDRSGAVQALNWSCYVLVPVTPTPVLEPKRLGEFQVEWYCNQRGYGVRVINNDSDWACTQSNNQTAFVLGQNEFNEICRLTYGNPRAYALRDQNKPQAAYNWSCYVDVVVTATRTPTAVPTVATLKRLGEFKVEWYCNERGYGVRLTNNDSDWACTQPNSSQVVFTLSKTDFDQICKRTYNDQNAVAIKDQNKPQAAYNWSCYGYR